MSEHQPRFKVRLRPRFYLRVGRVLIFWTHMGPPSWGIARGCLGTYFNAHRIVVGWSR